MTDQIKLLLPASSRFVATARVTAASVAAELDFPVDDIEDLRVGVNELAAVLVEWAEDHDAPEVELTFRMRDGELEVAGRVVGGTNGAADGDDGDTVDVLAEQILASVADEHELGGGTGRLVKRPRLA